ncbi:MAG: helix-turn-helix domain-containing protein [Phycisphaerae bacterium]|nr:helix-turn-helix domain-containing protein [Phycisphaerae bacterium]
MSTIANEADGHHVGPEPRPGVSAELLGIRDVCALLGGCSARSVYRLCDADKMPFGLKLNGMRRWRRAELVAWLDAGCPPVRVACSPARRRAAAAGPVSRGQGGA